MRNKNLTFIYYYYYYLPFRFSFVIKIYERIFNLPNFKKKFINLEKIIFFIYFLLTYGNVIVIRKRKLFCQNQRTSSPTPRPFPTLTYKNSDISKRSSQDMVTLGFLHISFKIPICFAI